MLPIKNLFGFRKNNELDKSTIQKNPNKNNTDLNKRQFIKKGLLGMAGLGGLALASKVAKAGGLVFNDGSTQTAGSLEGTSILSTGEAGGTKFLREDGDGTSSWQAPAGGDFSDGGDAGGANRSLGNTDAYDLSLETNNVAQLTIEGSATGTGVITTPNQSGCHVRRGSGSQTISNTTFTKVVFDTELYDIQGEFDNTTNYRFTVLLDGIYQIHAKVNWQSPVTNSRYQVNIYKNGSSFSRNVMFTNTTGLQTQAADATAALVTDDYIEVFVYHSSGGDDTIEIGDTNDIELMISKIA